MSKKIRVNMVSAGMPSSSQEVTINYGSYYRPNITSDGTITWELITDGQEGAPVIGPTYIKIPGVRIIGKVNSFEDLPEVAEIGDCYGVGVNPPLTYYIFNGTTWFNNGQFVIGYFTPSVDANGNLSWSNNIGLDNPATKNLVGPRGIGISSIAKTDGDSSPGTIDTYTITYSDGTTFSYGVYNGKDANMISHSVQHKVGGFDPLTPSDIGAAKAIFKSDILTTSAWKTLVNILTNGDFSNGVSGWSATGSTNSVADNKLLNTGNGSISNPFFTATTIAGIVSNKYYVKYKVRVTNSECSALQCKIAGAPSGITIKNAPSQNEWYEVSAIISATDTSTAFSIYHVYPNAGASNGKEMEVQYICCINLTARFGAGNEPTAEEMDTIMSLFSNNWFNGTSKAIQKLAISGITINTGGFVGLPSTASVVEKETARKAMLDFVQGNGILAFCANNITPSIALPVEITVIE